MEGAEHTPFIITPAQPRRRKFRLSDAYPILFAGGALFVFGIFGALFLLNPMRQPVTGTASLGEAMDCLEQRNFACAEADFQAYLVKYPKDGQITARFAMTLTQDGQHERAISYYKRAQALGVDTYDFDAGYARSLGATGRLDDAIAMNRSALQIAPTLVDVRGALADELARKGRVPEALDLLQSFDQTLEDEGQPPYFEAKINQIKAAHGIVTASAPAAVNPFPTASGAPRIALEAGRGELYVPVVVDDTVTAKFVVDSGATDVCIPANFARTLVRMGKLTRGDYVGRGMSMLANGSRAASQFFVIHSMRVGGHEAHNVTAIITPPGSPLLLGQSFLHRFKSWSIDNKHRELVLQD